MEALELELGLPTFKASRLTVSLGGDGVVILLGPKIVEDVDYESDHRSFLEDAGGREISSTSQNWYVHVVTSMSWGKSGSFTLFWLPQRHVALSVPMWSCRQLLLSCPNSSHCWCFRSSRSYLFLVPLPCHMGSSWLHRYNSALPMCMRVTYTSTPNQDTPVDASMRPALCHMYQLEVWGS